MPRTADPIRSLSAVLLAAACMLLATMASDAPAAVNTAGCPTPMPETPFAPWNDFANYVLFPGGGFEPDTPAWTLNAGATIATATPASPARHGASSANQRFLTLPPGSSATSPEMCIDLTYPTLRIFAKTTEPSDSRLAVHALFRTPDGEARRLKIAELAASGTWQPSRIMLIFANLLALHPNWDGKVAFRFTPTTGNGQWSVDDVYVDPYER